MNRLLPLVCFVAATATATAQVGIPPGVGYLGELSLANLGVLPYASALQFSPDGNTLYLAGAGNQPNSTLYALPVIRQPGSGQILGYGQATEYAATPWIDAGLEFGPNGVLFFTEYPGNVLGELVHGVLHEFPLPAGIPSPGGLTFVPAGNPNAGTLLISSFAGSSIYEVALTANPDGSFTPGAATLWADLSGSHILSEGITFVPAGPMAGDLLLADFPYTDARVRRFRVDHATGRPVGGPSAPVYEDLLTNLSSLDGLAFDPVTHDLLLTDWYLSGLYHFTGFTTMQSLTASASTLPVTGGTILFHERAGTANGYGSAMLVAGFTGTTPGTPVGSVVVPINVDFLTIASIQLANTSLFSNFYSGLDITGEGLAAMHVPPGLIPPGLVGTTLDFAWFQVAPPADFASNAVHVTIVH